MNRIFKPLTLIVLSSIFTFQSCLKQPEEICLESSVVKIQVRTVAETSRSNGSEIENLWIYVFDANDHYVLTWNGEAQEHGNVYEAEFDLEPGTYRFVVWSNLGTTFTETGTKSTVSDLAIVFECPSDGKITDDVHDIHYGMLSQAQVVGDRENNFTILLRPDTYRLNFAVVGLTENDDEYIFTITDNNTQYAFDNTIIEGQQDIQYIRSTNFENGRLATSIKTLLLTADRSPMFELTDVDDNSRLLNTGLVEMITKAYNSANQTVDFESVFEYDITISFNGPLDVSVTVNGWTYTPNPTEL